MPTLLLKPLFISKLPKIYEMPADGRLSRHLASQLGPAITVNTLALGPFRSKMMAATLDAFEKEIAGSLPMQRIGKGEDVAGACLWLSSKAGEWVTGCVQSISTKTRLTSRTVVPIDGGSLVVSGAKL